MDSRFLQSLIAVVETGSIAAAARREGLTPAAVGQRLAALEAALGVTLFNRSARAVRPAPACEAILPRARRIVAEVQALRADLDPSGLGGELRLGAISTVLVALLPAALGRLRAAAPRLVPVIRPGTSAELYEALRAGALDAALVVAPPFQPPKGLVLQVIERQPLCLLVPPGETATDPAEVFARHRLIRYDARAWGGQIAARYLADLGLDPPLLCELDALEAIALMVEQGLGASIVPRWSPRLAARALPGAVPARELVLMLPAEAAASPVSQALLAALGGLTTASSR